MIARNVSASETARRVTSAHQKVRKEYYDANVRNQLYKVNDLVYVRVGQMKVGECAKLSAKWIGPCVVQKVEGVRVAVLLPNGNITRVHHNQLTGPVRGEYKHVPGRARGRPRKVAQPSAEPPRETSSDEEDEHVTVELQPNAHDNAELEQPHSIAPPVALPDSDDESVTAALDSTTKAKTGSASNDNVAEHSKLASDNEETLLTSADESESDSESSASFDTAESEMLDETAAAPEDTPSNTAAPPSREIPATNLPTVVAESVPAGAEERSENSDAPRYPSRVRRQAQYYGFSQYTDSRRSRATQQRSKPKDTKIRVQFAGNSQPSSYSASAFLITTAEFSAMANANRADDRLSRGVSSLREGRMNL